MPELHRILSIEIEGFSEELRVVHFEGYEGISQLFEFEVTVGAESSAIAFADIVRKKASLTIHPDGEDHPRLVHGVVSRFEQGSPHRRGSTYRITVVPWAWMLEQRVDSRIFQDMTAPDIVQKVLQAAGYTSGDDFKLSLQGTYVTRDYCVQYRETDWDFVSRLLEEEGIAYFFEHDEAKHTLVLVDRPAAWPPIAGEATLIFRQAEGALGGIAHGTHVTRFAMSEEVRPGKVTLRDWNFEKPALKLEADKEAAKDTNLEVYDQPGEYGVPADGEALAAVRLEELQAPRRTGRGESTCARLSGGHELTLSEHPREDFNTGYLVTRVEHWGTEPDMEVMGEGSETPYRNRFEAIPSTVVFRPARVTRRPQIHGVQTAIVVGPQGEEIYADKHGRVKVQFHWDRLGKNDDKSSCWVRVAQMWASAAFGAMFLPRVKDEVVVAFLEGDPDKPLVVGRVYHGTNVVPYALPDEKTKSTIKSHSSPQAGDDAFNELRFEDKKGSEEVFLQAQKDWTINVKNDKNQKVGHDETLEVGNDRTKT
ncbi:MAG TPA: type VI secretion system tip protein VgrG, partial [Polyangiaceae bacterium]